MRCQHQLQSATFHSRMSIGKEIGNHSLLWREDQLHLKTGSAFPVHRHTAIVVAFR